MYYLYKRARVCVEPVSLMTYVQIYVECTAYFLIEVYVINHADKQHGPRLLI